MIINGGQVFILDDDILPKVSITGATVILDVSETAEMAEMVRYINHRVGGGSSATNCTFTSLAKWSGQRAKESISHAQADSKVQDDAKGKSFFGIRW